MTFIKCYTSYLVEHGRINTDQWGEQVYVPDRRIALVRGQIIDGVEMTVLETVNGRSYYLPGRPAALFGPESTADRFVLEGVRR